MGLFGRLIICVLVTLSMLGALGPQHAGATEAPGVALLEGSLPAAEAPSVAPVFNPAPEELVMAGEPGNPCQFPTQDTYFKATRICVGPAFFGDWISNGSDLGDTGVSFRESLDLWGYPISPKVTQEGEDCLPHLTQYFERARFESHPGNLPPYDVLKARLGSYIHGFPEPGVPALPASTLHIFFPQTSHNLSGRFMEYWFANGGLSAFGIPLTEARPETIGGKTYMVQWFERARFELHPENKAPYDVLRGQLGRTAYVITQSPEFKGVCGGKP